MCVACVTVNVPRSDGNHRWLSQEWSFWWDSQGFGLWVEQLTLLVPLIHPQCCCISGAVLSHPVQTKTLIQNIHRHNVTISQSGSFSNWRWYPPNQPSELYKVITSNLLLIIHLCTLSEYFSVDPTFWINSHPFETKYRTFSKSAGF